jgi:hypothetical protein
MFEGAARQIAEILNRVYSNQEALDRVAAGEIITYIIQTGWLNPEEVSFLVDAAGGEVIIEMDKVNGEVPPLTIQRRENDDALIFRTKVATVESGPIKVEVADDPGNN